MKKFGLKYIMLSAICIMSVAICAGCGNTDSSLSIDAGVTTFKTTATVTDMSSETLTTIEISATTSQETVATTAETVVTTTAVTTTQAVTTTETSKPQTTTTTAVTTKPTTTTTATTSATTKKPEEPKPLSAEEILAGMTLRQKVCQMFIVSPEQLSSASTVTKAGSEVKSNIEKYSVGGVIFFAKNLVSKDQTTALISNMQSYSYSACGVGMFMAVDEEGGRVARCAQKLGTASFSPMAEYGKDNDVQQAYSIGKAIGTDLAKLGFNVDFAPVADIDICSTNELGDRIFSSNASVVANMVAGVVKGLKSGGVCSTLKHFPGLGAEDGNTHTDSFVVIDRTLEQLRQEEFIAFGGGIQAGAEFVMVGHQIITGIGDDLPSDMSYKVVTECLKKELGFEGLVITDSQQMNTISKVYTSGEAAVMSIKAGVDIVLLPADLPSAVEAVCKAVENGEISEQRIDESVLKILSLKLEQGI